jgi:TM2 domain-containing membrane protein YozV
MVKDRRALHSCEHARIQKHRRAQLRSIIHQGEKEMSNANATMLYDANKRSAGVAYLLWFFLGSLGAHRYYLGKTGTAVAMTLLCVIGLLTIFLGVGVFLLAVAGIWALVDAFLIPGIVREFNTSLAMKFAV